MWEYETHHTVKLLLRLKVKRAYQLTSEYCCTVANLIVFLRLSISKCRVRLRFLEQCLQEALVFNLKLTSSIVRLCHITLVALPVSAISSDCSPLQWDARHSGLQPHWNILCPSHCCCVSRILRRRNFLISFFDPWWVVLFSSQQLCPLCTKRPIKFMSCILWHVTCFHNSIVNQQCWKFWNLQMGFKNCSTVFLKLYLRFVVSFLHLWSNFSWLTWIKGSFIYFSTVATRVLHPPWLRQSFSWLVFLFS